MPRRAVGWALVAALLALALAGTVGGQAGLGRIDPALAMPTLLVPLLALAWGHRGDDASARRNAALLTIFLLLTGQGLLALALAGTLPWRQLALTAAAGGIGALLADILVRRSGGAWRSALMLAAAIAWFGAGHLLLATLYRPAAAPVGAPATTMLTSLPLRWPGGGGIAAAIAQGPGEDPALRALEALGPVHLVDSLADNPPAAGGALLLAHPPALAPRDLVAVDAFVRGGGRAVILADALSSWPAPHPLGDPRNPPVTSLLTPLFDHWGIALAAAPMGEGGARPVEVDGERLRLFSTGRFGRLPPGCRPFADGRIAHCGIGAGEAWLIGDADLLFAPLWRPPVAGLAHLRRADTIEWLAARLWPGAASAPLEPVWIRSPAS